MKIVFKRFGIIAMAAMIVFSMIACDDGGGGGGTPTPVAADYEFGNLSQKAGKVTAVTITPKDGKSSGVRTIHYEGTNPAYAKSVTFPQAPGKYAVTFDVAEAEGWNAATGLSAGELEVTALTLTWTAVADSKFGSSGPSQIAYGNSMYIAVGGGTTGVKMTKSTDNGVTWTNITVTDGWGETLLQKVAFGGDKFVVTATGTFKVATSTDGTTWTTKTSDDVADLAAFNVSDITYGNGKFVAVGNTTGNGIASMAYSADGLAWTAVEYEKTGFDTGKTATTSTKINSVIYGDGKFVAVGGRGRIAYSTDGITWTVATTNAGATTEIAGIAYGDGRFVTTGGSSRGEFTNSTNGGVNWSGQSQNAAVFPNGTWGIAWGDYYFVAVGRGGKMGTSANGGITWVTADGKFGTSDISGIIQGNDRLLAWGSGKISYSTSN